MFIKPCPFCGGIPEVSTGVKLYAVTCKSRRCEAAGPLRPSKEEAVKEWNRRAGTQTHMNYLPENIQALMTARRWNVSTLEHWSGVKRSTIYNVLDGRTASSITTIQALADGFDVDVADLLKGPPPKVRDHMAVGGYYVTTD